MPQKSRWTVPVPEVCLPTFLFGSPTAPLGDGLAYADADRPDTLRMTWTTFRLWSQRLAAGLLAAGLRSGDRVVVSTPNDVFFPVLCAGVIMAGGIFSSANARYVARELAHQLGVSGARFLIVADDNLPVGLEAAAMVGMGRDRVFVFDDAPLEREGGGEDNVREGVQHWRHLLASEEVGRGFVWEELTPEECKTRCMSLVFSSGTTGLPKGVEHTHYSLIANAVQTSHVMSLDPSLRTAEQSARSSRWHCSLPLYHGLALCYFVTISVPRRVPTYIMKHYSLEGMLAHVERFRITELHLVPPIVIAMTRHPGVRAGRYDLSSVTKAFSCAAPLGPEPTLQFEALWPRGVMNVKQGLASSESGCNTLGWDPTLTAVPGSVGEPMPNCEVQLVDDSGREVARGERGEIWVRCPNVMKGYWNNPAATAENVTAEGWLKTGDVAFQDARGWYYVVDRKKELIKVKGVQVAPAELEAILLDHPHVADAAVIGVKRGEDEAPRAYVVPAPGATVTEKDIMDFMDGKVSSIKKITGGVVFTESIPKTPSGKILRKHLREMAAKESKL